jgi:hypothetical protein
MQSAGYKRIARTAVIVDPALGEIDRKSIEAAEWTRWPG